MLGYTTYGTCLVPNVAIWLHWACRQQTVKRRMRVALAKNSVFLGTGGRKERGEERGDRILSSSSFCMRTHVA